jgi:hypothetical protein
MLIDPGDAITMAAGGPDSFFVGSHTAVPEPSTWALGAIGMLGLALAGVVKRRAWYA